MLVLFANLKAGFSPSDPGGAGVVSIWIPEMYFFRDFFLGFLTTTENEPFPKKLSTQKQTKRREMDLGGRHADL